MNIALLIRQLERYREKMLALLLVLILSAVPSPLYSEPCWEENQANHQVSDFKNESKTLQYLALEIEQDLPGERLITKCSPI